MSLLRSGWRSLGLLGLGVLASGCGFHLRGEARLPAGFHRTCVTGLAPQDSLMRALKTDFRNNGVALVKTPARAGAVLHIQSISVSQRTLTVSTPNQANAYALIMTVVFSARATGSHWRMPSQTISVRRQYSLDTAQLQSQGAEEQRLRRNMAHELADLVLLRLQAFSGRS